MKTEKYEFSISRYIRRCEGGLFGSSGLHQQTISKGGGGEGLADAPRHMPA